MPYRIIVEIIPQFDARGLKLPTVTKRFSLILKMVAMRNNPKRTNRDLPDQRSIAKLHGSKMNSNRIGKYAKLLDHR